MIKRGVFFLVFVIVCTLIPIGFIAQGETTTSSPMIPKDQLVNENGQVIFADSLVETAIRALLGVPEEPLTPKQLAGMGANGDELLISATYPTTVDLSVLQLCTKLKSLRLELVTPADPRAITALANLQSFSIWESKLNDYAFLADCKKLSNLSISGVECRDIAFVAELPKLSSFSIGNYVPDLSPLYTCRKLTAVSITAAIDAEVNALLDAIGKQLTYLGLNGCAITDDTLTRISGLRLRSMMLESVHVSSLSPVWNMKTLQQLGLFNVSIDSLEGIQSMKSLRILDIGGTNNLTDYKPLFQLTNLQTLRLGQIEAPNLKGIESLKNLKQFSLEYIVGTVNLDPVFAMTKLKTLILNGVTVKTLSGIEGMKALTELSLYKVGGVKDYMPLSGLTKLKALYTDVARVLPEGLPVR